MKIGLVYAMTGEIESLLTLLTPPAQAMTSGRIR